MTSLLVGLTLTLTLGAVSVVVLRIVSRHHSTACPAWLVPLLENPYMNALAGAETLLHRAGVTEGMAVLDVGCGPGRVSIPAARQVGAKGRVLAVDLQPAMIERLEKRVSVEGITNVDTLLAGCGEGAIPHTRFDRALLVTVLGEIVDQAAALGEIYDALKPGGILSVTEVLPDPHYQSRSRVRRLAEAQGFRVRDVRGPWYAFTMNLVRD